MNLSDEARTEHFRQITRRHFLRDCSTGLGAAWLVDYGMKRLPADLTAAELRIAACLIAKVAETLPEQKKHAITLLDRALSLAPEDAETLKLRETLKAR